MAQSSTPSSHTHCANVTARSSTAQQIQRQAKRKKEGALALSAISAHTFIRSCYSPARFPAHTHHILTADTSALAIP